MTNDAPTATDGFSPTCGHLIKVFMFLKHVDTFVNFVVLLLSLLPRTALLALAPRVPPSFFLFATINLNQSTPPNFYLQTKRKNLVRIV
jgi:hypothetical protein